MQGEDVQDDQVYVDALETLTVTQSGTMTEQTVEKCIRRPVTLREIEGGVYVRGDMKFHLPKQSTTFAPATSDTITDAAAKDWTIQEVELLALGTRYRCWCKPA
jgi:hypothetical protein